MKLTPSLSQDGRYSSIHMSAGALRALDFPDDTDFGIIPPFDDGQQPRPTSLIRARETDYGWLSLCSHRRAA